MIFVGAILLWLLINYFTWWLAFNTILCFLVGLFLIMPVLLDINFSDIKQAFGNKRLLGIDILLNFILVPIIAFLVGYFIFWVENYQFIIALVLLSLIPWWGLLMAWLKQTKANIHTWFVLFTINLFLFSIVYIWFNFWVEKYISYKKEQIQQEKQIKSILKPNKNFINLAPNNNLLNNLPKNKPSGCVVEQLSKKIWLNKASSCFGDKSTMIYGFYGFLALILIPFLVSRLLLLFIKKWGVIHKYAPKFSKISTFILITYIFSLNYIRQLKDIDINLVIKTWLALIIFYVILYFIINFILNFVWLKEDIKKAVFWNVFTRFLTLSLILTFLYAIAWHKVEIIIIPILAYFIQISFALIIARKLK